MRTAPTSDAPSLLLLVMSAVFAILAFPARRCGCTRAACRACFRANACCPVADHDPRDW